MGRLAPALVGHSYDCHLLNGWMSQQGAFDFHRPGAGKALWFTDEQLDFITNYDIKYRMGLDGEAEN